VSIDDPQTVSELFADTFATRRRLLMLLGSAAVIVLLLTAFSLVSALGQFVAARRRELAIRMAVGAEARHVAALLARHLGAALLVGLALGAAAGLALARALSAELFGVEPADPSTFAETLALLAVLAALAAIAPVWRASRIDVTTTLRVQ
jgi:putative ABC transport system permease protein